MPHRQTSAAIKTTACALGRYQTFAELAAAALAFHWIKAGHADAAEQLLLAYLEVHAPTPRIATLLRLLEADAGRPQRPAGRATNAAWVAARTI